MHEYEYTIRGQPAFAELDLMLKPGQKVYTDGGSLSYMREGVERGKLKFGGLGSIFGRTLGGQSVLQVSYTGLPTGVPRLTLASPYPGDILHLRMQPGTRTIISRGSFVAGSPNVQVNGRLNWRGAFMVGQEEGLVLPELQCAGDEGEGSAWLGAYGGFMRHVLEPGQIMLVDNGLFLACARPDASKAPYKVVRLGSSLTSSFFGGEGLGMEFSGPCILYTQSHNFNDLVFRVAERLPNQNGGSTGPHSDSVLQVPRPVQKKGKPQSARPQSKKQ